MIIRNSYTVPSNPEQWCGIQFRSQHELLWAKELFTQGMEPVYVNAPWCDFIVRWEHLVDAPIFKNHLPDNFSGEFYCEIKPLGPQFLKQAIGRAVHHAQSWPQGIFLVFQGYPGDEGMNAPLFTVVKWAEAFNESIDPEAFKTLVSLKVCHYLTATLKDDDFISEGMYQGSDDRLFTFSNSNQTITIRDMIDQGRFI